METIITAKWKKAGRILVLSLPIATLCCFVLAGLFANYEHLVLTSRWQMVLFMLAVGSVFSLILTYLTLWVMLWKLEIKGNEMVVSGFLKRKRCFALSELYVKQHGARTDLKIGERTIARMSVMVENSEEIVSAIKSASNVKASGRK